MLPIHLVYFVTMFPVGHQRGEKPRPTSVMKPEASNRDRGPLFAMCEGVDRQRQGEHASGFRWRQCERAAAEAPVRRAIGSPSPPPRALVVKNGSKTRSRRSSGTPGPLSRISIEHSQSLAIPMVMLPRPFMAWAAFSSRLSTVARIISVSAVSAEVGAFDRHFDQFKPGRGAAAIVEQERSD